MTSLSFLLPTPSRSKPTRNQNFSDCVQVNLRLCGLNARVIDVHRNAMNKSLVTAGIQELRRCSTLNQASKNKKVAETC